MRIGVDLDDVIAVCAVPYLKRFAQDPVSEKKDHGAIACAHPFVCEEE